MKKTLFRFGYVLTIVTAPSGVAFAAITDFSSLVNTLLWYIQLLVPFILALTLLVFLWGIFKLVFSNDSDKAIEEGKKFMTWGIVSLFVMVSVWGLVRVLTKTFFNDQFFIPQLRTTMLIEQSSVNKV